jgi:hypothetical protein
LIYLGFSVHHLPQFINNSLAIGSRDWNRLIGATKPAGIYAGLAYSELKDDHSTWAKASFLLLVTSKPTATSSDHQGLDAGFSPGSTDGLKNVVTKQHGRIGVVECGE